MQNASSLSSSTSEDVLAQLSLESSDSNMLRGVRLSRVQQCCARLLQSSDDTSNAFDLSSPVDRFAAFISHNWDTPRLAKFVTLAVHFNAIQAIFATLAVIALTTSLTIAGVSPIEVRGSFAHSYVSVVAILVLVFVLLMGHSVGSVLQPLDPLVFLDKACICQTDPSLKQHGIEKLAAFLWRSSSLVVIYTDAYLCKLWTTYELGTFLAFGRANKVHVVPIHFAIFAAVGITGPAIAIFAFTDSFYESALSVEAFYGVGTAVVSCLLIVVFRAWAHAKCRMKKAVDNFCIKNVKCSVESDRLSIEKNIISFMKHFKQVSIDAGDAEVLHEFDLQMKVAMRDKMLAAGSNIDWPPPFFFLCSLVILVNDMDKWSARVAVGTLTGLRSILTCISYMSWSLLVYPLLLLFVSILARRCVRLSWAIEVLYVAALTLLVTALSLATNPEIGALSSLCKHAESRNVWLVLFVITHTFLLGSSCVVFGPKRWRQHISSAGVDGLDTVTSREGQDAVLGASLQVSDAPAAANGSLSESLISYHGMS